MHRYNQAPRIDEQKGSLVIFQLCFVVETTQVTTRLLEPPQAGDSDGRVTHKDRLWVHPRSRRANSIILHEILPSIHLERIAGIA